MVRRRIAWPFAKSSYPFGFFQWSNGRAPAFIMNPGRMVSRRITAQPVEERGRGPFGGTFSEDHPDGWRIFFMRLSELSGQYAPDRRTRKCKCQAFVGRHGGYVTNIQEIAK